MNIYVNERIKSGKTFRIGAATRIKVWSPERKHLDPESNSGQEGGRQQPARRGWKKAKKQEVNKLYFINGKQQAMKDKDKQIIKPAEDKDTLSQKDIKNNVKNIAEGDRPRAALETPDGKNNGAEPTVFKNQRKAHT